MSGVVYKVAPMRRMDIRLWAHFFRRNTGYENEAFFPVVDVMELLLPRMLPGFVYEYAPTAEMGTDHGRTYPSENRIVIREDVYEGALEGKGRDRLTIAHEIGHLLLHRGNVVFARTETNQIAAYESSEWQANCFGGELLVSATSIPIFRGLSIAQVAEMCGTSYDAADYQIRQYRKEGLM